jgi:HAD superfamily PSPase-like hydrolase|tara:strand:- start:1807 stop:2481 length:675 start_codon:yes stop_codon:yes gene_type:complete
MSEIQAVVFDCDGVLVDIGSSWQQIHNHFNTNNLDTLEKFLNKEITDNEFMEMDIKMWLDIQEKIHMDEIMRCFSGVKLMEGARDVVEELQKRGIYVAIVSSGVARFIGSIAHMLNVDDWAANDFGWDEEGFLKGAVPSMVDSHDKGIMVEKLSKINNFTPEKIWSVGDSSTDLSMQIPGSNFIGFNPARQRALDAFKNSNVPVVIEKDLREIWGIIFNEQFPN